MKVQLFGDGWRNAWDAKEIEHEKLGLGFEIDFTQSYDPHCQEWGLGEGPLELSFEQMESISEQFGTNEIDFNDWSKGGCDTCGYGSEYGYKIQVYKATKNAPVFGGDLI